MLTRTSGTNDSGLLLKFLEECNGGEALQHIEEKMLTALQDEVQIDLMGECQRGKSLPKMFTAPPVVPFVIKSVQMTSKQAMFPIDGKGTPVLQGTPFVSSFVLEEQWGPQVPNPSYPNDFRAAAYCKNCIRAFPRSWLA
ncbi:hypothetical protein Ancab_001816 [Ancistrocladus abbreviatus]